MRFRNENLTWSAWQPFTTTVNWSTSPGNGWKTVSAEVYNGGSTYVITDTIYLNASPASMPVVNLRNAPPVVTLSWGHATVNLWYEVYRSSTQPYLVPGQPGAGPVSPALPPPLTGTTVTFDDSTALPNVSYFYLVRAVAGDGLMNADSPPIGRFMFGLVPGG